MRETNQGEGPNGEGNDPITLASSMGRRDSSALMVHRRHGTERMKMQRIETAKQRIPQQRTARPKGKRRNAQSRQ